MPVARVLRHVPDADVDRGVADFGRAGCDPVTQEPEADGNGWKVTAVCPTPGDDDVDDLDDTDDIDEIDEIDAIDEIDDLVDDSDDTEVEDDSDDQGDDQGR